MKINRKWLMICAMVLLAAGIVAWWQPWSEANSKGERYRTDTVERSDLTRSVSANGTLNPVILVSVGTQVSGTVKKLLADFNARVEKGQVLAELDDVLFSAQVAQSEAALKSARASLDLATANEQRMQSLFKQEYASRQDLDSALQSRKSAQAEVDRAMALMQRDRANFGYSVIRSPVAGVVVDRQIDVGQTVAASFQTPTLFKIAQDLSKMQIDTSFAEADIGVIKVGQEVDFTVDAFPRRNFSGIVKQVRLNPTTQSNVVTYNVVVAVDNLDQTLLPGMTAYVHIAIDQRADVLTVSNAALRFKPSGLKTDVAKPTKKREPGSATVYVLDDGKPRAVSITTGITDSRYTEVTGGDLKGGEVVITGESLAADSGANSGPRLRMF